MLICAKQILVIFSVLALQPCCGQVELDFPDASIHSSTSRSSSTIKRFGVCDPEDAFSESFCKCTNKVVSCDFSAYTKESIDNTTTTTNITNTYANTSQPGSGNKHHVQLDIDGGKFPPTTSRFCICNTPPNLHLIFSMNSFLPTRTNKIQRFDLFNLTGITQFNGGFAMNFNGDLYIANVSNILEIQANEFGRGTDEPIQDVQDQVCCSPIKLSQRFAKPVLFIENSTIDRIMERGFSNDHLWKTLVLKSNTFKTVDKKGINYDGYWEYGYDVAILDGKFANVSPQAILFRNAANLFLSKNTFKHSNNVTSEFFGGRSSLKNSNILLLNNGILNELILDIDAKQIFVWDNFFDLWDNRTFDPLANTYSTAEKYRSVSFRYNIVRLVQMDEINLDSVKYSELDFSGNVLGTCNCMQLINATAKSERNWCYTGNVYRVDANCSVKLDEAVKHCGEKPERTNFDGLCRDKTISVSKFPYFNSNLMEDVKDMRINSTFISRIVEEFPSLFEANHIAILKRILANNHVSTDHGDADSDQNDEILETTSEDDKHQESGEESNQISKNEGSTWNKTLVPIVVIIVVLFLGLGFSLHKYRHRFFRRFAHHEPLSGSHNSLS